jgi:hypothetical protein
LIPSPFDGLLKTKKKPGRNGGNDEFTFSAYSFLPGLVVEDGYENLVGC